ncbi:hypothetical protein [Caldivirga sp. UBA161]|uniref:ECF transporter S component n=1 Tax=Caldivirga sp. UBA161 TaxID=1915569 RepID=UPI0025B9E041|nr:hypothetical protein [Caldivirga sp. UBA161]
MALEVSLKEARAIKVSLVSVMAALSVALSFIQIPFPVAPFLKYDLAGIPLIITALLIGPKYALLADTVLMIALLRGGDPIGAAMKWIAEASTFIPMYYTYRLLRGKFSNVKALYALSSAMGITARVGLMVAANYVVDPWWFLIAHWVTTYTKAASLTMYLLPVIALFNLTIAIIYIAVAYPVYLTITRRFRWLINASGE